MHLSEDIKKRWQQYTEELYKKGLPDLGNCSGVDHSLRARHTGMRNPMVLMKHNSKQS